MVFSARAVRVFRVYGIHYIPFSESCVKDYESARRFGDDVELTTTGNWRASRPGPGRELGCAE